MRYFTFSFLNTFFFLRTFILRINIATHKPKNQKSQNKPQRCRQTLVKKITIKFPHAYETHYAFLRIKMLFNLHHTNSPLPPSTPTNPTQLLTFLLLFPGIAHSTWLDDVRLQNRISKRAFKPKPKVDIISKGYRNKGFNKKK